MSVSTFNFFIYLWSGFFFLLFRNGVESEQFTANNSGSNRNSLVVEEESRHSVPKFLEPSPTSCRESTSELNAYIAIRVLDDNLDIISGHYGKGIVPVSLPARGEYTFTFDIR